MEIYSRRIDETENTTLTKVTFDNFKIPFGFFIEDIGRKVKVKGKTRISAGRYKLGIKKEDTTLTIKHRESKWYKDWFKYHIEVIGVPNFHSIYFHMINTHEHTEGCQGGSKHVHIENGDYKATNSTELMKEFYSIVYPLLEKDEDVYYTIID